MPHEHRRAARAAMIVSNYLASSLPNFISPEFRDLAFVLFWITLSAAWFLSNRLPGWIRSIRAASWPIANGMIETVNLKAFGQQALGGLGYSYLVEGSRYSGYFSWQFGDEQQAWDCVTGLQGQPVSGTCGKPRYLCSRKRRSMANESQRHGVPTNALGSPRRPGAQVI